MDTMDFKEEYIKGLAQRIDELPDAMELAKELSTGRMTVDTALKEIERELREEGVIYKVTRVLPNERLGCGECGVQPIDDKPGGYSHTGLYTLGTITIRNPNPPDMGFKGYPASNVTISTMAYHAMKKHGSASWEGISGRASTYSGAVDVEMIAFTLGLLEPEAT